MPSRFERQDLYNHGLNRPRKHPKAVPSIEAIKAGLGISAETAKAVYDVLVSFRSDGSEYPVNEDVDRILAEVNKLLDQHGVVSTNATTSVYWPLFEYVVTGETYDSTVIFDRHQWRFLISSWGDRVETYERRFGAWLFQT